MKQKTRGFEIVSAYKDKDINLPVRKTKGSAAYDIESAEDIVVEPFHLGIKPAMVPTGLKSYFPSDECLLLLGRSSGPKKGLLMSNSVGLIDSDYYNNEGNEGHFYFPMYNVTEMPILIKKGDVIGQGIFQKILTTDDDNAEGIRTGGFGSTDKK